MLRAFLAGDGSSIAEGLLSRGYDFKRKQKGAVLDYIQGLGADVEKTYTVTNSSGWVGKSFVLPHKTYGDPNLKFRDVDPSPDSITEIKGTRQGWKDNIASRCAGNSRLILALGASFAAPLLPIGDVESGGFHLVGATSQGKTTILSVAASVTGIKAVSSWRTTDNALEGGLAASNHLCLPMDELNQADPRKVGAIVYMLGNGIGKGRSTKEGINRKPKIWLTLVLSSGETTIGKFMELAGEAIKGGQEVRLPNVTAIPENSKYGCFETIHGADTAVQFVSALESAVKEDRGTALDAFLSRLVVDAVDPMFGGNLSKQVQLISAKLCEGTKDSAIGWVAKRFALVQAALGLAHKYDLLPFDIGQIEWAISECFNAWLKARGGDGSIEIKNAIERIEHLLVTNEFSERVFTLPNNNDRPVRNLLAYRSENFGGETEEFLVPTTVFDREFSDGVNKSEVTEDDGY
jgi:putative DNA primase/helicase